MTKTIRIEGMSCAHCTGAVTKVLQALDGVASVDVSLDEKQAVVKLAGAGATDDALRAAIEEEGFQVVGIE